MVAKIIMGTSIIIGSLCFSAYAAEDIEMPESSASGYLKDKFYAGDYWSVGSDGLDFLSQEPGNDELRMIVADSLAWTGRYADAIGQYQMLAGTSLSDSGALGLANIYRWTGRPDLASPLYQRILTSQPDHVDALDGLNRIDRELRPRTEVNFGTKSDSNSVTQNISEINHYWRGGDLAVKYELSLNTSSYIYTPANAQQMEIGFSAEHTNMAMSPKLDLSIQQDPVSKTFALLRLKLLDAPDLQMTIGHVNWGYMAFQPQALLAGLDASQFGVLGSLITRPGTISAAYTDYRVSDGNQIQDSNLQFSPSWRPLGADFRYYIGVSGRFAQKNVPYYWSPDTGYRSTNIGFTNEWSMSDGDYSLYGQRGFAAGGEALNSYSIGLAAKRYIGKDWAASLSAGMVENQRTDAYHSNYLTIGAETLW